MKTRLVEIGFVSRAELYGPSSGRSW